jgi:hypothetical protein
LLRHYWISSDDAEIGAAAGVWIRTGALAPLRNWTVKQGLGDLWLTVPFMWALGEREIAIYWRNGAFGALGIVSCALLSYELGAGIPGAAAAAWLLAMTPFWLLMSLSGIRSAIASCALAALSLALWLRAARLRHPPLAVAAALCLGLALWTRSTMLAWLFGVAVAAAAGALPAPWIGLSSRRKRGTIAACAACLLFPQVPTLLSAFRGDGVDFWLLRLTIREYGDRYSPVQDLLSRLATLRMQLEARGWAALPFLALVSLVAATAWRTADLTRRDALPWLLFAAYLLASVFSPTGLGVYHTLPLIVLFWAALCALASKPSRRRPRALACGAVAALLVWRTGSLAGMIREFNGPLGRISAEGPKAPNIRTALSSDAAVDLYSFFERRPENRPVFVGWTPGAAFVFRSRGTIVPVDVALLPDRFPAADPAWAEAFASRAPLFVVAGSEEFFYQKAAFCAQLARRGLRARLERSFNMADGSPGYDVYRAFKAATGSTDCGLLRHPLDEKPDAGAE